MLLDTDYAFAEATSETSSDRFNGLVKEALDLIELRVSSSPDQWYKRNWGRTKENLLLQAKAINGNDRPPLPMGILAEVIFLNACNQQGIVCSPTDGREDAWGADFTIGQGSEVRFIDVTVNYKPESISHKLHYSTFPTLFLPWNIGTDSYLKANGHSGGTSYLERYIRTGEFDTHKYLEELLGINYEILHCLKCGVWKGHLPDWKFFSNHTLDVYDNGVPHLNNLEGSLKLLKRHLYS